MPVLRQELYGAQRRLAVNRDLYQDFFGDQRLCQAFGDKADPEIVPDQGQQKVRGRRLHVKLQLCAVRREEIPV